MPSIVVKNRGLSFQPKCVLRLCFVGIVESLAKFLLSILPACFIINLEWASRCDRELGS